MATLMHRLFLGWLVLIDIGCLRLLRNLNWYLWGKIAGCDRYFAPRTLSCLGCRRPQSSSQAAWPVLERGIAYCGYLSIWVGQLALQVCVHRIWYMTMRYNEYVETQGNKVYGIPQNGQFAVDSMWVNGKTNDKSNDIKCEYSIFGPSHILRSRHFLHMSSTHRSDDEKSDAQVQLEVARERSRGSTKKNK